MTKQNAYDELTKNRIHWDRLSKNTIRVWMSSDGNGSHHENLDKITNFLSQAGFKEIDRDFDRICGKGFSDYREINIKKS